MAKVVGQHTHQHTHPEVLGIHVQLVTVQLAELSKGALEVVDVFQAITEGVQHLLAMGLHLTVAHNGISRRQVPKGLKEPLSPGVDNQQPEGIHSLSLGLPQPPSSWLPDRNCCSILPLLLSMTEEGNGLLLFLLMTLQ
uniref:Uncharacterized protein n=1 Tax=Felis catus TaxID=9685 RepID=A0ABI7YP96_FELCA